MGNGVVQLVDLLHLQRLQAVGPEEQIALHEDGDKLEAWHARDVGAVDCLVL